MTTIKTNGFTISAELKTMLERFEKAVNMLLPNWEIEYFYYGDKLVMATIRGCGCEYAE